MSAIASPPFLYTNSQSAHGRVVTKPPKGCTSQIKHRPREAELKTLPTLGVKCLTCLTTTPSPLLPLRVPNKTHAQRRRTRRPGDVGVCNTNGPKVEDEVVYINLMSSSRPPSSPTDLTKPRNARGDQCPLNASDKSVLGQQKGCTGGITRSDRNEKAFCWLNTTQSTRFVLVKQLFTYPGKRLLTPDSCL